MFDKKTIKSAFESMLFMWGEPLQAKDAGAVFGLPEQEAVILFQELAREYEEDGRGIRIRQVAGSFQFVTPAENADFVRRLCTPVKMKRLSQAALEVLAIIAYRQPVTKGEIDQVRGVKCDRVVEGLLAKGLVREAGRSDAVGRPVLYRTTEDFLAQFGFRSLDDLPEIEDVDWAFGLDAGDEEGDSRQLVLDMSGKEGGQNG